MDQLPLDAVAVGHAHRASCRGIHNFEQHIAGCAPKSARCHEDDACGLAGGVVFCPLAAAIGEHEVRRAGGVIVFHAHGFATSSLFDQTTETVVPPQKRVGAA